MSQVELSPFIQLTRFKIMKNLIKKGLRKAGFRLNRTSVRNDLWVLLSELFEEHNVSIIADVGANRGQYLRDLVEHVDLGSRNVYCFEPLKDEFEKLHSSVVEMNLSQRIKALNFALGAVNEQMEIQVTPNRVSSSFLHPTGNLRQRITQIDSEHCTSETVEVKRYDDFVAGDSNFTEAQVFLKLDVQGYELHVLEGVGDMLDQIEVIQVECAFEESYVNRPVISEILGYLQSRGFKVAGAFPGYFTEDDIHLHEIDLVLHR